MQDDHPAGTVAGEGMLSIPSNGHSRDILSLEDYPLLPHHRKMLLQDRAIAWETIVARGTRSIEDGMALMELGLQVYPTPGILIPINPIAVLKGEPPIYAYRPDKPSDPKRKYYWQAGVKARLDINPLLRDRLAPGPDPIYFLEGWLKLDAVVSAGARGVALLGTSAFGWKPEPGLPILHDWAALPLIGQLVRILFDSDTERKSGVALARQRLTALLEWHGAVVQWVVLPDAEDGSKLGADDWLALGHTIEEIEDLVVPPRGNPYVTAPLDDIGNAERFVYGNADRLRWNYEQQCWYSWDGRRWDAKNQERILTFAHETAREAQIAASRLPDTHANREHIVRHALKLGSSQVLNNMVSRARDTLGCGAEVFDVNPWLLNAANGTIDLTTGVLLPHSPDDMITKLSPARYAPDATLPEWDAFLASATAGKAGLLEFLQAALGYSITGDTSEERVFMPIGKTRSGKSTLVEAVAATLGDYAATASFDTFVKRNSEGIREDLARLAGARFVSAIEVEEGKHLADAIVKQLTGGDTITARLLYQNSFSFAPQLKLWLVANEEPTVSAKNEAMWERILRLPFDHYVPPEQRDKALKARLKNPAYAGAAVLAWLVVGALRWRADGLVVPASVTSATQAYKARMDPLTNWLEDDCIVEDGAIFPVSGAFPAYLLWAKKNGVDRREQLGRNGFKKAMLDLGFTQQQAKEKSGGYFWVGVQPRPLAGGSTTSNGHHQGSIDRMTDNL